MQKASAAMLQNVEAKKASVLTRESYYEAVNSKEVANVIQAIQQLPEGKDCKELKVQLPAAMYMAQCPEDGHRPNTKDGIPTGLLLHDWDHLPMDVTEFFNTQIKPRIAELGVVLAHVTPSGKGLRLVTHRQKGMSIEEGQILLAQQFGVQYHRDEKVKDICRLSFIVPPSYILYIDEDALFNLTITDEEVAEYNVPPSTAEAVLVEAQPVSNAYAGMLYKGEIPFSAILQKLEERITGAVMARTGERNNTLYFMARNVAALVAGNFEMVKGLLQPIFAAKGLKDAEISKTIASATGVASALTLSPMMTGILNELKAELNISEDVETAPEMPALGKFFTALTAQFPKQMAPYVTLASLPMLGFLATGVRYRDLDMKLQRLTLLVHVMAPPASGKSYVTHLKNILLQQIVEEEKETLRQMEEERIARNSASEKDKKEFKKHMQRLVSETITMAALYEQIANSNGKHLMLILDEISDLARGSAAYTDLKKMFLHSFGSEEISKSTISDQTANVRAEVNLSSVTCGTFRTTNHFFKDAESGLDTRFIFLNIDGVMGFERPIYSMPNSHQQALITNAINALQAEEGEADLPQLRYALEQLDAQNQKTYELDGDRIRHMYDHRSLSMGYRAGIITWILEGKPACLTTNRKNAHVSQAGKRVIEMALWVAKYAAFSEYTYHIDEARKQIGEVMIQQRRSKNAVLYDELPSTFSVNTLTATRSRMGLPLSNPSQQIKRWIDNGWVMKQPDGHSWTKTYDTAEQALQSVA